ncbi:hypothetical protein MOK15_00890 [Sphingobium sp. BYY-5]|uniref:hypothetical protein n=1 Tax=Sphingobium sp. BYY-5 TaxID=2926400 RepID=UPI001FA70AE4|nr:hypothetical protein [Sphingobium sp. BYY-5]MCI4588665.1 hypothetical protein [Sphingobium sp. BYY-5]
MPADKFNESGYWESRPIYELNEKILSSGGGGWADWQEFNPNWFRSAAMDRYRERGVACVEAEFGNSNLFVIKDPRFCLLMPFWRSVFESMDIEPVVIHTLRNPIEVARSLEHRNKFLTSKGVLLWLRYTLEGERGSRGLRRFFTSYDDLMEDHVGFIERSQEALGLFWPRNSDKTRRELGAFLTDGLRHHREHAKALRSLHYAAKWVETAYDVLRDFAARGEDEDGRTALDAVHAEFTAASHGLGSIAKDNDERFAQLAQMQEEREALQARQIEQEQHRIALEQERDGLLEQAKAMEEVIAQSSDRSVASSAEAKAATALQRSEAALKEKAAIEEQHREALEEREALRAKARSLESEIVQLRQRSDELKAAQAEVEAKAVAAQERADAIQRAKTALEGRHLATQKERDALRQMQAELEKERDTALADGKAAREETETLRRDLQLLRGAYVSQAEVEAKAVAAQERADAIQRAKTALEGRHLATQKERDALRQMQAELEKERDTALADGKAAREETETLRRDLQLLRGAYVSQEVQYTETYTERNAINAALAEREASLTSLEREFNDTNDVLEMRTRELADVMRFLADVERSATDSQIRATQTEKLAKQWESRSAELVEELAQARATTDAQLAELRDSLAQTESALRQRQLETEQAADALLDAKKQAQNEREEYAGAQSRLERDLAEAHGKLEELKNIRAELEESVNARFNEIAQITEQLATRENDLAQITERLATQEDDLARMHGALADQEKMLADMDRQKRLLRATAAASQAELERREAEAAASHVASLNLYQHFTSALQAMLANAVLPFASLTRKRTEARQRGILAEYAAFDADWYVAAHPDLVDMTMDPALHYIRHGLAEGRAPNAAMEAVRIAAVQAE